MEWCMDLYSVLDDTPATDPLVTQVIPAARIKRVAKNGSYATTIDLQRSAVRFGPKQDAGHPEIGFRLVYSPPPPVN